MIVALVIHRGALQNGLEIKENQLEIYSIV